MRKTPKANKRPNPLQTSWGSTLNSSSNALSAPQRLLSNSPKSKKPRPFRSKGARNRNSPSKG